jgi:hypothetical protein
MPKVIKYALKNASQKKWGEKEATNHILKTFKIPHGTS